MSNVSEGIEVLTSAKWKFPLLADDLFSEIIMDRSVDGLSVQMIVRGE
jgi:hypothetical protein